MTPKRVVLDTNALISRLLLRRSIPAQAVDLAITRHRVLASEATLMELAEVLSRAKFDPYLTIGERQDFLRQFDRIAERIEVLRTIRACRDPKDDKFLELAVEGATDIVVTGDGDLLALNPFQAIAIVTPAQFLELQGS
jgi:putative PIN family toxin of toxin-antitoxin system